MYTIILERIKDLEPVIKNNKEESGMFGTFRVFERSHDDNASDSEIFKHYDKKNALISLFSLENSGEPTDTPNLDKPIVAREYY